MSSQLLLSELACYDLSDAEVSELKAVHEHGGDSNGQVFLPVFEHLVPHETRSSVSAEFEVLYQDDH